MIVFDTYAWIEYFIDGKNANSIENYLKNEVILTPILVLLEISNKANKENWDIKKHMNFIKLKSTIFGLTEDVIIENGKNYNNIRKKIKDFGIVDSTILTTARINNCKILTGDPHFKSLDNVELLT